jgi:elongation factor Ts
MSEISASLVKELREKIGVGMMDCKKALVECNGDFDAAIEWLRKKGHAAASKKSDRSTSEGVVVLSVDGNSGAVIEINSETDFVARNEKFQEIASNIAKIGPSVNSLAELSNAEYSKGKTVQDAIIEGVSVVGENLKLSRFSKLTVKNGIVASYVHNHVMTNGGKIAVLLALEIIKGDIKKSDLEDLGKRLAMHIAAAKPEALNPEDVSSSKVDKEKEIFSEQARASGKPENIIEKMVEGRIRKYFEEIVLNNQIFVMDNKTKISDVVSEFAKKHNSELKLSAFIRYELGEGAKE